MKRKAIVEDLLSELAGAEALQGMAVERQKAEAEHYFKGKAFGLRLALHLLTAED